MRLSTGRPAGVSASRGADRRGRRHCCARAVLRQRSCSSVPEPESSAEEALRRDAP